MAFGRLVFTVLLLSVSCYASIVPVYLWGDLEETSLKANPLKTIDTDEFNAIIRRELVNDPFVVIFAEKTLSVDDFSRKDSDGETSFPYLHSVLRESSYLPAVVNPLDALNELSQLENVRQVALSENGLSEIESESNKLLINFNDARIDETRPQLLGRHDIFMKETVDKLREKHDKVIAVYTSSFPSFDVPATLNRVRRQTESNVNSDDFSLDGLRLYAYRIEIRDGNNTISLNGNPVSSTEFNETLQTMNTTLTFGDNSLVLNFREQAGYWFFDSLTLNPGTGTEEYLQPELELFAITGFSYRCGQEVIFSTANVTRTVVFENMQVQPFFKTTNESIAFGDSFDCVGFFTAPIWAGLLVTFILLSITFYGIMMMMDIKTMDRFDDPKGKTITINALD